MRKIFFKKLKANDGYHRTVFKNGYHKIEIPVQRNGSIKTYIILLEERQNKKKPRLSFYLAHEIKGNWIQHKLSDNSIKHLDDYILEQLMFELDKFIYEDNKEL